MGTIDLEDSHIEDMTVEQFISAVVDLEPALRLVEVLLKTQVALEQALKRIDQKDALLKLIVGERDAAIARNKV